MLNAFIVDTLHKIQHLRPMHIFHFPNITRRPHEVYLHSLPDDNSPLTLLLLSFYIQRCFLEIESRGYD